MHLRVLYLRERCSVNVSETMLVLAQTLFPELFLLPKDHTGHCCAVLDDTQLPGLISSTPDTKLTKQTNKQKKQQNLTRSTGKILCL